MTRAVVVLRPEPGNGATCAAVRAAGGKPIALPLFEIVPTPWRVPDPTAFDALLLTSANAVRAAGGALAGLGALPVYAVGAATASAARAAGLTVASAGGGDIGEIAAVARGDGKQRLLHLAGRNRMPRAPGVIATIEVYHSRAISLSAAALVATSGTVAMLHSPRAARRLAALLPAEQRATIAVAALSPAVAEAAGPGWRSIAAAAQPNDTALVALALRLAN